MKTSNKIREAEIMLNRLLPRDNDIEKFYLQKLSEYFYFNSKTVTDTEGNIIEKGKRFINDPSIINEPFTYSADRKTDRGGNLTEETFIENQLSRIENKFNEIRYSCNLATQTMSKDYINFLKGRLSEINGEVKNSDVVVPPLQYKLELTKDIEAKVLSVYQFWNTKKNTIQGNENIFANIKQVDFLNMIINNDFTALYNTKGIKQRVGYTVAVLATILGDEWGDITARKLNTTIREMKKNTRFNEYDALKNQFLK